MKKEYKCICGYVCDKYYIIDYNRCGDIQTAKGFLINYYGGNVVLLSEEGVYHIKYKDIVFMRPTKMPNLDKFNEGYQNLLKLLQEDNT